MHFLFKSRCIYAIKSATDVREGSEVPDLRHDVALAAQVLVAQAQEVVDHKSLQGKAAQKPSNIHILENPQT
jgi:hypothetical protein